MLKKRVVIALLFNNGVLYRTRNFIPNNIYTYNFVDTWSADEIIMLDISRSDKNNTELEDFLAIVKQLSSNCFVPLSVGGKISSLGDAERYLKNGADKIVLNSNAFRNNMLVVEVARKYGSQCVVVSIDVKKSNTGEYKVFIDNGQVDTGMVLEDWLTRVQELGAGEIFLNSIDKDGMLDGYDKELIGLASRKVDIPLIVCGGAGAWIHLLDAFDGGADGACTTNIFHFTEISIASAKKFLHSRNIDVRQ